MRLTILVPLLALAACRSESNHVARAAHAQDANRAASSAFDRAFTGATMRCDYLHCGTATEEHIALAEWRVENAW
ncbi:MAG: peptidase M64 N-terminal domain-containing protein, partial [Aestuariivirga sp.]